MADAGGHHWEATGLAWNSDALVGTPLASSPPELTAAVAFSADAEASSARNTITVTAQQPSRPPLLCCIAGCGTSLEDGRYNAYNRRTKLCTQHMRAAELLVIPPGEAATTAPRAMRFCQKCNTLQDLSLFEGDKHTCREKLREHNKRRRDRNAMRAGGAEADEAPTAVGSGDADQPPPLRARRAAASQAAELIARVASGGSDADGEAPAEGRAPRSRPRRTAAAPPPFEPAAGAGALRTALASGDFDLGDFMSFQLPPPSHAAHMLGTATLHVPAAPDAAVFPGNALTGMQAATVHLKLPNVASPAALPQCLNGAALSMFAVPPIALTALARPGCVLLTLDALLDGDGPLPAQAAVAALKAGAASQFFRAQRFSVAVPAAAAAAASFAASGGEPDAADAADAAARAPPRTPRVRPLAALSGADVALRCLPAAAREADPFAGGRDDVAFAARLHGHALPLRPQPSSRGATLLVAKGATEGVALLEVLPRRAAPQLAPPPRPVLLCADARIVAEVCAAADGADAAGDDAAADAAELAVCVLGAALRPGAGVAVLAAACAEATERGWVAVLGRLLPLLRAAAEAAAPPARDGGAAAARLCARGGASLLHRACAGCSAPAAALLLSLSPDGLFGAAATRGPDGLTPAHHAAAAAAADGGALASALTASGDGLVAWFYAAGRDGASTPAAAAPAVLDAPLRRRLAAARSRADAAVDAALRRAFLQPALAAAEALEQLAAAGDDDAAALLRWTQAALMRAEADDGGSVPKVSTPHADDDAGFTRWQAAQIRPLWRVMTPLLLAKALGNVVHCVRFLRHGPQGAGPAAHAFVAATSLRDPATGDAVLATSLPPEALRRGAWSMLVATALLRVPHAIAAVWLVHSRAGWALTAARHELVMGAILGGEALFFVYTDALLRHINGGLEVEWPSRLMLLRAVALTAALRAGPFRTAANRAGWVARSLSSGVALALRPALRGRLWHNVGYRVTVVLLLLEALAEPANQRRLRRTYAAHAAKEAAKCGKLD